MLLPELHELTNWNNYFKPFHYDLSEYNMEEASRELFRHHKT